MGAISLFCTYAIICKDMQLGAVSTARVQLPAKVPADWLPPTDDLYTSYHNSSVQFHNLPVSLQFFICPQKIIMARWHATSCDSPRIQVGDDSIPKCQACGNSAHHLLQSLTEHPSSLIPSLPPDEPAGKLNLSWPSTITYTRTKSRRPSFESGVIQNHAASSAAESLACPKLSEETSSRGWASHVHDRMLREDEFRLIALVARENESPTDVIHLMLETYSDREFPEYEAVSYTWGGESGDATL